MKVYLEWGSKITKAEYLVEGADLESAAKFLDAREEDEWGVFDGHISTPMEGRCGG